MRFWDLTVETVIAHSATGDKSSNTSATRMSRWKSMRRLKVRIKIPQKEP